MFSPHSIKCFIVTGVASIMIGAAPAYAAIDFENANGVNIPQKGGVMTFDGFDFSSNYTMAVINGMSSYGADNGTNYFVFEAVKGGGQSSSSELVLTRHDGTPFRLTSLDLGGWLGFIKDVPGEVKLVGQRVDGTQAIMSTMISSKSFSQVAAAADFTNLLSLSFALSNYPGTAYIGIDNIQVSPVPEPENIALFLAGLGLLGCMAKRGKRA